MKKCLFFAGVVLLCVLTFLPNKTVCATNNSQDEFLKNTYEVIDQLDTGALDSIFNDNQYYLSIKGNSFKDKLKFLLSQDVSQENFIQSLFDVFVVNISKFLPFFIILFIIAVLSGMVETIKPEGSTLQMSNVIYLVCYLCCITVLLAQFLKTSQEVSDIISNVSSQMQIVMPLILSLMAVSGMGSSVAIYRPIVLVLSNSLISFIMSFLLPLVTGITIINLVTQLTDKIKLNKLREVLASLFKWVIGLSLTVFSFFLTVKGIYASKSDGVSISAIKYLTSQVPIVGGFLREGTDIFIASSELIKNGVGKMAVFILFWEILSPAISMLVIMFGLNIVASLSEPFADAKIVTCYGNMAKTFGNLLAIILMVSFMFVLTLILLICSSAII